MMSLVAEDGGSHDADIRPQCVLVDILVQGVVKRKNKISEFTHFTHTSITLSNEASSQTGRI